MTSWMSSKSLLLLLVLLTIIDLSKEGCTSYFYSDFMRDNLTKSIPVIETKDPKDKLECSLEHKCQQDSGFCPVLDDCFFSETAVKPRSKEILPKCEGIPSRNVSFYQFMCTLAKSVSVSNSEVCKYYDATCSFLSGVPYSVTNLTTPTMPTSTTTTTTTALPERTTPALPLNTTSVQPSANAGHSADKISAHNSTGDTGATVTSEWRVACLLLLAVCFVQLVICLLLCHRRRRDAQLLQSIAERNHVILTEIQTNPSEPHANGEGAEATTLIETEASINGPPVGNGSEY